MAKAVGPSPFKDRNLWAAVLVRAVADACMPETTSDPRERGSRLAARRQALDWFAGNGPDFRLVCELAGVDPNKVHAAFANGLDNVRELFRKHRSTLSEGGERGEDL